MTSPVIGNYTTLVVFIEEIGDFQETGCLSLNAG
jgi:hypothetical protein